MALADLNGDGIPDLIVANSGSNNVLIYPGLGNGQFGPAINGGNGYFVGTNPVGITVANLTGDLWPDLVVADEGSNDVSILLNRVAGRGHQLRASGAVPAALGPVSTVVQPVKGGLPRHPGHQQRVEHVTLLPGRSQATSMSRLRPPSPWATIPGRSSSATSTARPTW